MKTARSDRARHIVLRAEAGDVLPDAIARELREHDVRCGWLRGSGVLADVELVAFSSEIGQSAAPRRVPGPVQAIILEGSIGMTGTELTVSLRAVLGRETDRGLETIAGEIVRARVVAVEAVVSVFDDVQASHAVDGQTGVMLLDPSGGAQEPTWKDAASASADAEREPPRKPAVAVTSASASTAMPTRIAKPVKPEEELQPVPEPGDAVEHFAFGPCDVLKSDGDRLHLRLHKDQRIKEIALEMLKITPLPSDGSTGGRRFKLDRKM